MKKFISILLVLSLICYVPSIFADGGDIDCCETTHTQFCDTCGGFTSCEVGSDFEYSYFDYYEHWVTEYEAIICTSCNSRLSRIMLGEYKESHFYDRFGICGGCLATWD